jgi:hypothetical protein
MKGSTLAILAAAALLASVSAECANACSGHGVCSTSDQCDCFPNYKAADCSERVCPYGLAWVDSPRGDLNHDGLLNNNKVPIYSFGVKVVNEYEKYPTDASTGKDAAVGEAHFYSECSNKGLCDRELGQCVCFDGYTGSSCQRTECPNACSGHGVCRTVEEIAANRLNYKKTDNFAGNTYYVGVKTAAVYRLWDMDMAQSCVCDPGYSGADCSQRECPRGDDPLTHRPADCGGKPCNVETQTFTLTGSGANFADWMYIKFTDWTGKVWSTDRFLLSDEGGSLTGVCAEAVISAATLGPRLNNLLESIPNGVLEDVTVSVTYLTQVYTVVITFTDKPGNVEALEFVRSDEMDHRFGVCNAGTTITAANTVTADGNGEEATCSNRGVCDFGTGLCKCFKGYTSDDCSVQNALAA